MSSKRHFLFLQGPHGPYFWQLAKMLMRAGAQTSRVGFNMGDHMFWGDRKSYIPFTAPQENWEDFFTQLVSDQHVTDIVLYGDARPIHAQAVQIAQNKGITVHVFEEGYLRPYWITYERGGSNGNSKLMDLDIDDMRRALGEGDDDLPDAPALWGDMRQHIFYGALYHGFVLFANHGYRAFRPHRSLTVAQEFQLYLKRLITMPVTRMERWLAQRRIAKGGFPYHLVMLQLEHDSSFQAHSPFTSMTEFLEVVVTGFAAHAPRHHHLVFKAHPLEDGRAPIRQTITKLAKHYNISDRVHYVKGGKLARLLNDARSAITVNSTAGQQALWRGLPIKVFGSAVYAKPEFVSEQSLTSFFTDPKRPEHRAYKDYRNYLLETSQVTGGFYSARGRQQLLRQVVDMMLCDLDPYAALEAGRPSPRQNLRLVTG